MGATVVATPEPSPSATSFPTLQILREDGTLDKSREPVLRDEELLRMYRTMLLVRTLDGRCMNLQRQGRIGFYGTATGEEAAVVGSAMALRPDDWIFPALRQGGALLLRGFPLTKYFGHLFGNSESVELGRSMPCHYSDRTYHFVTWSSSMATQLPHAVGMAYAAKLRGDPLVAMGYLGDGASSEGDFHVSMNFAAVWKCPVVFFCNNNQWAISVPYSRQSGSATVAQKAIAYGMPGVRVDGNDVLACYAAAKEASERARRGEGPTLIEAVTYRMMGHSSSDDPTRYRSSAEVEEWGRRDPLLRFRRHLAERGLWSESKEAELLAGLNEEISRAIEHAEQAGPPPADTLVTQVYAEPTWLLRRQWDEIEESRRGR